jgi:acetamidase/formamidase
MRSVCLPGLWKPAAVALSLIGAFMFLTSAGERRAPLITFGSAPVYAADQNSQDQRAIKRPDHVVRSTPENVTWGEFPSDKAPIAVVQSGDTVRIDTLSHAGATQGAMLGAAPGNEANHPVTYLAQFGVRSYEVLKDVINFWLSGPGRPRAGRGGHILTGPIYIEGAEPGDMLEIQVLDLKTRVPYGINNAGPGGGVLGAGYAGAVGPFYSGALDPNYPGRLSITPPEIPPFGPVGNRNLIFTAKVRGREVALFAENITVPLAPFMGIMAVSPEAPEVGAPGVTVPLVQSSTPPGVYGGNMDVKDLTIGSTLYLPVFHPGALFYTGDPHSAQGDGEVSGTAIEHSLTGTFRFIVHKGKAIAGPRAEDATHYIMMGIDLDLDRAMRLAVQDVVNFLVSEKGLAPGYAYSLASIAVDFHVGEAVDQTQIVTGKIPKAIFRAADQRAPKK